MRVQLIHSFRSNTSMEVCDRVNRFVLRAAQTADEAQIDDFSIEVAPIQSYKLEVVGRSFLTTVTMTFPDIISVRAWIDKGHDGAESSA